MTEASISFDRAADTYDATRALPADIHGKIIDAIVAEVSRAGADRILELGVGTGRMARPLAERGLRVTGVDISPRMLARLGEQLPPDAPSPDLILGDVVSLPLSSASHSVALAVHVLHLIPSWQLALEEVRRVVGGGVFIHYNERYVSETDWGARSDEIWDDLLARRRFTRRRRPRREDVAAALEALGGTRRTEVVAQGEDRTTPAAIMDITRRRVHSWTWEIPTGLFFDCLEDYGRWLKEQFADVEAELVDQAFYELDVWSFDS